MKTELIDHPLFLQIRQEHDQIRSLLSKLNNGHLDLKLLNELYELAEVRHHLKEENLLFKHLLQFEGVNGGGPLCMLYFDDYILNHPVKNCEKLLGFVPEPEAHLNDFFEKGSVMRIPINEHLSGKAILETLIRNFSTETEEKNNILFKNYFKLQMLHMEKEENCFFFVCANFLTQAMADKLLQLWLS